MASDEDTFIALAMDNSVRFVSEFLSVGNSSVQLIDDTSRGLNDASDMQWESCYVYLYYVSQAVGSIDQAANIFLETEMNSACNAAGA